MIACRAGLAALAFACAPASAWAHAPPDNVPGNAQTVLVVRYLTAMRNAQYDAAFGCLDDAERAYYGDARNFASIYTADAYRITTFALVAARGDDRRGRVYFARETARFRDHAHDIDLTVRATVPVGVIREDGGWRIKDPGHPMRAFATRASANASGVRIIVKKMSFFPHRIEAVVTFVNTGARFVTVLAYGKSILHDAAGRPYRIIETKDWSLTDKTLFEGLRLAPDAQYTGTLAFTGESRSAGAQGFSLTVAPLLADGADAPFEIDVDGIAALRAGTVGE
jgi:hypothetical protein